MYEIETTMKLNALNKSQIPNFSEMFPAQMNIGSITSRCSGKEPALREGIELKMNITLLLPSFHGDKR